MANGLVLFEFTYQQSSSRAAEYSKESGTAAQRKESKAISQIPRGALQPCLPEKWAFRLVSTWHL
jgi:hypothetical protein